MYKLTSYARRSALFVNNNLFSHRKKLSTLMIYATDLCDSGCKHCLIWAKRPVKYLSKDKIVEIMQSKCVTKQTVIGLEGGEFLLHPQAMEIMSWLREYHPNFDLLSNCLKPDKTIEAAKRYLPKRLYVSLDGDKETYKYMRGKDGHDGVIKVIEQLRNVVPISVMFTLSPYNDFDDMRYVAQVCRKNNIDLRVGIYNDIAFFDTVEKAHQTDVGTVKKDEVLTFKQVREEKSAGLHDKNEKLAVLEKTNIENPKHDHNSILESDLKGKIPDIVKDFAENYDFIVLYDEWRKKQLKLRCHSILDSLVILPNGDVPICQNLDLKLGNLYQKSLDEIFNGEETREIQHEYSHNCNQCWINFHRKYDIVLYRNLERFFSKAIVSKMFGYYQWEKDGKVTHKQYMKKLARQSSQQESQKQPEIEYTEDSVNTLP